ncbi:small ribosomal subunit protein mS25-like [Oculina patagonica]
MAAKSRVYLEALKYLDSHNGKIGKYAVQRTIEHLKRCNVILHENVKQMRMNIVEPINHDQRGAIHFFYENFPQLKFKNPHVEFLGSQEKSQPAELLIKFVDDREEKIITAKKEPSKIMQEVINIAATATTTPSAESENSFKDDGT